MEPAPAPPAVSEVGPVSSAFSPLPHTLDLDPAHVDLGRRLFADRRLSGDGGRACVDCHTLDADGLPPGPRSPPGPDTYDVPTIFNVGFQARLNWLGPFGSLEEHVGAPLLNPAVMGGGSWEEVIDRLAPYQADFVAAGYPGGVTEEAVREVLATWERSLVTPDAPFDLHLRGEAELEPEAARGLERFVALGCSSCHQGTNLGGNLYERFGVLADPWEGTDPRPRDHGRTRLSGDPEDDFSFRVPSLRNVARTAPYFHDGSAPTLDVAVRTMARVQLGVELDDEELSSLLAFLGSLTGRWQGRRLGEAAP